MATREIWHEILINASLHELYQAVTDVKACALVGHRRSQGVRPVASIYAA